MAKKSDTKAAYPMVDRNWQAEDDLRTLMRACEIRKDKDRFAAAKKLAKKKLADLKKIDADTAGKG